MKKLALLTLCGGLGVCGSAGAAPAGDPAYYPGQVAYGAPAAGSDGAIFELLGRLEQLQSEVQQLRGMVEEQTQTIADLERKQSNMYSDLDDRIQALTGAAQPGASAAQAAVPAAAAPAATPAVVPTPALAVPTAASAATLDTKPAVAPSAPSTAAAPAAPATPPAAQGNEKERYQQAYDALRNGHNAQAVKMFDALLGEYPAGEFSDNAQYWLGEAHKMNRDNDKARAAFNKVVNQYPNSSKIPDALLKLGYIELEQQNAAKARDYFTRVVTSYPGSTAAHLASKKLTQMPQ